jgi:chromosomal replication initiator protein
MYPNDLFRSSTCGFLFLQGGGDVMSPNLAWKTTLGELELQMTKATFNTWLRDARLLKLDENDYVIGVRNDYAKDWLENRLSDTILRTLNAVVGEDVGLRFQVSADEIQELKEVPVEQEPKKELDMNGNDASGGMSANGNAGISTPQQPTFGQRGTFSPRYRFSTFIVGQSNRLAHAAALSVAEKPGQTYNPLFIYGGVGLGKTHLLHAIGQRCMGRGMQVLYVSSEMFTNDLVQSIRSQQMAEFRDKYRTPDVLLIDDIQFIAGKESTQEEMFHTFNDLHSQGKQVVLSSDRPPKAMVTLEERLQSRFEWGLMADIQLPDIETRLAILQAKAESSNMEVESEILELIARHVHNNIRELEGALNKVVAYAELSGGRVDDKLVAMALADLMHKQDKVTVEDVMRVVAKHYSISIESLSSNSRSRSVSFPRQIAMYLARTETDASFPQIGTQMGNRDHTTILYGYEKINAKQETDSNIRRDLLKIKAALYEGMPA